MGETLTTDNSLTMSFKEEQKLKKRATKMLDEIKEKYRQNAGKDKAMFINMDEHSHLKFKEGSVRQAHVKTELMANLEKSGFGVALSEVDDSSFSQ